MADEDIIRELHEMFHGTRMLGPKLPTNTSPGVNSSKPTYRWYTGRQRRVLEILTELRPYLHSRRGAKADILVAEIQARFIGETGK